MFGSSALAALVLASSALGHATFQQLWVNGVDKAGICVRNPQSNSPLESVTSPNIACNVGGDVPAASTCAVPAGATVIVEMHQQPGDRTCATEAIGGNHDGPTIIYMAKVADASTAIGSSASWFKVAQTGLVSNDFWGTDVMNAACGKVSFKVPADIAPGDYLIKAEVIALHVAGNIGGAQFYSSCFQVNVSGTGKSYPPTVKFPGAYSATDPGILFNLYASYSTYTIPGPAVYTGGGSTVAPPTPSVTTQSASPSATIGPLIPLYGQCGGTGWTGSTNCGSGSKCVRQSDYYSQCVPA